MPTTEPRTTTVWEGSTPVVLRTTPYHEELTLRMLGDNVSFNRTMWHELLESLKPESDLARRVRDLLRA